MPLASVTANWLAGWGQPEESGGAPGAGILGRRPPRPRPPTKKKKTPDLDVVIKDVAPLQVILDEPWLVFLRHRQEDDAVVTGLL